MPLWFAITVLGGIVILLGIHQDGDLSISNNCKAKSIQLKKKEIVKEVTFLMLFSWDYLSFGWTPCVGPVLSSVFSNCGFWEVMVLLQGGLLIVHTLGLFRFLSNGFGFRLGYYKQIFLSKLKPYMGVLKIGGALIILMGIFADVRICKRFVYIIIWINII